MRIIGIDIGMKQSHVCELDEEGVVIERAQIPTTRASFKRRFGKEGLAEICIEAGGSSPWVDRLLREYGHSVFVVNPHRVKLIAESTMKTDKIDAEVLARLLRCDRTLLRPVTHRTMATQRMRSQLRVRELLVKTRTACINAIHGVLRLEGYKLPSSTSEHIPEKVETTEIPPELREILGPVVKVVEETNEKIQVLDKWVRSTVDDYPEVKHLQQIDGVGPLTALAFVLCIEDPERFADSRKVAAYLGLRPRLRESSGSSHSGRISKEGDSGVRRLLVQCAHGILRSRSPSDLKAWGEKLAAKKGKKKAVVALARKLAVLMHRLWRSGADYDPLYEQHKRQAAAQVTTEAA